MGTTDHNPTPTGGGIARWSLHHPVAVVMLTLAVVMLGLFSLGNLKIDLLPRIVYPSIGIRVNDPGVPARIMEDEVTRQLEEQLAITEDAIHIRSATREGRSAVDLDFAHGADIDTALRDASTRLDRAKRFLPETIEPPVIYKRDPSQLPAAEYAIRSTRMDPVELRQWVDYVLSKWLINIPGVAAAEVAGGLRREIQVLARQDDLAVRGLDILDLEALLEEENRNVAGGRLRLPGAEIPVQTRGRLRRLASLEQLPVALTEANGRTVTTPLEELARIHDGHEEPRLRIRLNQLPAIKLSIQKQPQANTVAVVDGVHRQIGELQRRGLIPPEVTVATVNDEARHIRRALNNATTAALSGALLAMLVVWLFLGSIRRTLIIGSAIPIAILVTITLMSAGGLTLNVMTLGGLALGIGMLVDSTIVMLENIYRHQRSGEPPLTASERAAGEVTSAIVAATSTNLAAVLPFLFIGGLIGLLFNELILTISAAIVAAMMVALTLVPALAGRIPAGRAGGFRRLVEQGVEKLQDGYAWVLGHLLGASWLLILIFSALLAWTAPDLLKPLASFLPKIDDGRIRVNLTADRGVSVDEMDRITRRVEDLLRRQPEVETLFTTVGGFTFGRSRYETANKANIQVQLVPASQRVGPGKWIQRVRQQIAKEAFPGVKIRIRQRGMRGLRVGRGNDDIAFQVQGPDLDTLERIGIEMVEALRPVKGLRNPRRSNEDLALQLSVEIDRDLARQLNLNTESIGRAVRYAMEGRKVSRFIAGDRSIDILLRLEPGSRFPAELEQLILMGGKDGRTPIRLEQVARIELTLAPATILREQQQRIVEVTATLEEGANLSRVIAAAHARLKTLQLPDGYTLYEGGSLKTLQQGRETGYRLLALALFLVLVVMAVQYESLRNPLVILFSVFFSLIGVALGLKWTETPLSMPVWLGLIMLAGIVVNNAIILVEYIEQRRAAGLGKRAAILEAARLRLRPILMTTLTTVVGMLPLALAIGEGSEMLQPLAITLVSGLGFSLLVTLLLVPAVYIFTARTAQ